MSDKVKLEVAESGVNIFDMFETDTQLEQDGVKLVYGTNSKGKEMEITIARAGGANVTFMKVYEHLTKPYRRQLDSGMKLPKELNDKLNRELYARAVVRSMSGFEERGGTPLDTSTVEGKIDLFTRLPNLFADVLVQAQNMSLFRQEVKDNAAGN